ncbi:MAG: sulfotransferase domain-containing protein [Dinoroseobacter sp.]|nr:sulfotransferase domain-containing protein [Dinoroseobacter sp.]
MKPTAIGIGVQKCATSWMHSVLGAHPQVGVSDPKEVDFFSYYFDRGYHWYERHFDHLPNCPVRCDTSPSYFYDARAASRAWHYRSDLKVIALLRDPVARAYSNHLHEVIKGHIEPQSFEQGLRNNPTYLEQGLYFTHLKRWMDMFGPQQVLVLLAEEIQIDPVQSAATVYDFIGVNADFVSAVASERRNVSDLARSPGLRRALRSGGDLMRRVGLEEQLVQLKSTAPVAGLLKANSVDLRNRVPPMQNSTKHQLLEYFAPEVHDLADMLGRQSLPWPTWKSRATQTAPTPIAS